MIEFGPFRYDAESRFLYRGDEEIMLPPRVLAVLESLLKRPRKVVAKEAVLESAWEGAFVGEDSLTQAISQLRSALGDDPQRPEYIQTIPKRGYRFVAEVSEALVSQGPVPRPAEEVEDASANVRDPSPAVASDQASVASASLALTAGTSVGKYELVAQIGAGAMGEVWQARDTELQRYVAIKVVPAELAGEAAVLERLRREALMLAAVNHPNIATIHGVEEVNGTPLIVMELLEGETLQERLEAGALPTDDALKIAIQIARALEVAHEAGIVHRDLKPGNIMLGAGNHVKVLDFGLAKDAEAPDGEATVDPTLLTASGLLVGTAAYMSPEQAAGKPIDKRSDIFSFGCVLFEMLAGRRPFAGDTASEMVAAILKDAPDWTALPETTPADVRALLRRCLRKNLDRRMHDIADARIEIEEAMSEPSVESPAAPAEGPAGRWWALPLAFAAIAATVTGFAVWYWAALSLPATDAGTSAPAQYFQIGIEPEAERLWAIRVLAISPDGRRLAYTARLRSDGWRWLFLRSLDEMSARMVPDSRGAHAPFFSPDGNWVGFLANDEIKKVSFLGGAPAVVGPNPGPLLGGHWGADDVIYFGSEAAGIYSVPATGGTPVAAVPPDLSNGEQYLVNPDALPGGGTVLVDVSYGGRIDDAPIYAVDLLTGGRKKLIEQGSHPKYVFSGHLVFARRGELFAVPFDPDRLEVTGDPVAVLGGVATRGVWSTASYDVSRSGTLVYVAGGDLVANERLLLLDQEGGEQSVTEEPGSFMYPKFSPDGSELGVSTLAGDMWIYDLERLPLRRRLNFEGINNVPVWTPDGERIVFASARGRAFDLYWGRADGTGQAELLWESENTKYPVSWSPDGQLLAFEDLHAETGFDISILRLGDGPPTVEPFVATPFTENVPQFAPVGLWIAYQSDDSGQNQAYVEPYPRTGVRYRVSAGHGMQPIWSRDGTQLFYATSNPSPDWDAATPHALMVVDIQMEPEFQHSEPRVFSTGNYTGGPGAPTWDVAPDGRFGVNLAGAIPQHTQIQVVLNWAEELKRLVPTGR